jgi:nicotinamidase-related amidase
MPKTGLGALLRPEDSILVLIDHQPYQFANLNSHEPTMVVNNVIGLAKTAKVFNVPTILSTVLEERGGYLIKGLQDVFPEQKPIDRTFINAWQDEHVVDIVKKSGRKQARASRALHRDPASPCQRSRRRVPDLYKRLMDEDKVDLIIGGYGTNTFCRRCH